MHVHSYIEHRHCRPKVTRTDEVDTPKVSIELANGEPKSEDRVHGEHCLTKLQLEFQFEKAKLVRLSDGKVGNASYHSTQSAVSRE